MKKPPLRPLARSLQAALPRAPERLAPPILSQPAAPFLERKHGTGGREVRSYVLQLKAVGEDGTIEGYGSVFGVRDVYDDVIAPGAYAESLKAHKAAGTMPAMLWQHDASAPIGVWLEMVEDAKGLRIKGRLALETAKGAEAYALLKMGALNGLSIGFVSKQWAYDRDTDVRTLTEVELWEVSLVTFPANEAARITGVKAADVASIKTIRQAEQTLRDAGFSADAAKALIAEVKRIALDERDAHEAAAALKAADRLLQSLTS
ncbi:MAG: HK97 family phage prohead protease [Pseudomonadota bacterium]